MQRSPVLLGLDAIRIAMVALALLLAAGYTEADTIVLKNGRRITAFNVVETGDKIKYETSAGELTLPKSIVDHIEKGGAVPMPGAPGADAASLAITPPAVAAISRWPPCMMAPSTASTSPNSKARRAPAALRKPCLPPSRIMPRPCLNWLTETWTAHWPTNAPR
jgi:hypothetical protein